MSCAIAWFINGANCTLYVFKPANGNPLRSCATFIVKEENISAMELTTVASDEPKDPQFYQRATGKGEDREGEEEGEEREDQETAPLTYAASIYRELPDKKAGDQTPGKHLWGNNKDANKGMEAPEAEGAQGEHTEIRAKLGSCVVERYGSGEKNDGRKFRELGITIGNIMMVLHRGDGEITDNSLKGGATEGGLHGGSYMGYEGCVVTRRTGGVWMERPLKNG